MAKKKVEDKVESGTIDLSKTESGEFIPYVPSIPFEDLMASKLRVTRDGVELFYLDPGNIAGTFVLRPIPQPVEDGADIPDEWRKPTPEQMAAMNPPKIDWEPPTYKAEPDDNAPAEPGAGEEPAE